jgi:lipopolysaccharide export system permease protein
MGPFIMTFFIALFVLLMQFLWKYVDDLIGKGLEWYIITELMIYACASLVPLALPLAILLSSIMTFGNMGENYELVAMKSAGLSIQRIMAPLVIQTSLVCLLAFYFSNNILPVANLKMGTLLYDITHQKPAIEIKEGIFYNGIDNYSIRVGKKEDNGNLLKNLMIYDHSGRRGSNKVIIAESGTMTFSPDNQYMILYDHVQCFLPKGDNGFPVKIAQGHGFHDGFYLSGGKYTIRNTSNHWTANGLRKAGIKAPLSPITSGPIMRVLRRNYGN